MRNRVSVGIAFFMSSFVASVALFGAEPVSSQIHFTANLGAAGSADIAMSVLTREGPPSGETVLIVPGFAQTAATFDALSAALFRDELGNKISRVIVIDHPGHGNSRYPAPQPQAFGSLLIEHYASVVLQALGALNGQNIRPTIVIGHSLGGEIVMLAQQQLVAQGSSLHDAFGINGAILLAPAMPAPLPWLFDDSGAAAGVLGNFIAPDPAHGLVVNFPPAAWVPVFYGDPNGSVPNGAPTPGEAASRGYISLESGFLGIELLGLSPFPGRPIIPNGLFDSTKGTTTGVIAMGQDVLFLPAEERSLYSYLTNDDKFKFFSVVEDASAVHNMYTFNPDPLLHPIKKVLNAAH